MIKPSLEIVSNAKLKRLHTAVSEAYLYHTELKRKIALRKVLKEMKQAARSLK